MESQARTPRVLIVEDNAQYAVSLVRSFRQSGSLGFFEVDIATDLSSAWPYVERDEIDIYVVDLALPKAPERADSVENGKKLVSRIVERTNAGILVHSDRSLEREGEEMFALGADDYLEKGMKPEIVRAQAFALWRRIRMTRQGSSRFFVHTGRTFRIRDWRFVIGDRVVTSDANEAKRLSPTEHALLAYLCTVEDHQIDRREFNEAILNRPAHMRDQRIDNLIYRIRQKIGECLPLTSKSHGAYKLVDVKELRTS